MIKCILIDDEAKALKMLQRKIAHFFPDCEILATFQNPEEALMQIDTLQPDLVFLDISMPNMSGFDFLSAIDNPTFEVIFVTAFNQYAIEAIKHAAIGYIVKPIDDEELQQAVEKAKENINLKVAQRNNKVLLELLSQKSSTLSIPTQNGYVFVKKEDIVRFEGTDGYTKIVCCKDQEYLSSYSLGKFASILDLTNFFQAHRSHIINLKYVVGYLNEGYVELSDKSNIPLSKNKRKDFLSLMEKI